MGHKGIMIDRVLALITKFINMDPETVKYRVHRRAVRRLNNVETPDLFAEDLLLYNRSSSKVKSIVG